MSATPMTGKSFKGNLEVFNLSDIFQSLAMNRHSGTLVVTDGKREKSIFFAEGEITLLSSSRRQRLGELLVAAGKISEEDLDLALKLQKQSRKRLGEILVEEGFCDEEDIHREVHRQIEEEIYDLFLWKDAEFEFIADQMPEGMAQESPNLLRLSLNTNSLIMEALRRIDEWSLIRDLVPSTKEVFTLIDPEIVRASDVPERLKADPEAIDGYTTLEGLAERYFMSEFELSKHMGELVQLKGVRAWSRAELGAKAEEAYALNNFTAAAALYSRLSEYTPDQPKILSPLADSLRRTGAERQALGIYDQLAAKLEQGGKDFDRLRQCYEAITQIDPSRHDVVRKLEDLDLRMATPSRPVPLIAGLASLGFVVLVGLIVALTRGDGDDDDPDLTIDHEQASQILEDMNRAKAQGNYEVWFDKGLEIWRGFKHTSVFDEVELPLVVRTTPPGYEVYINGVFEGVTPRDGPLVCDYKVPCDQVELSIRNPQRPDAPGLERYSNIFDEPDTYQGVIEVSVVDAPNASSIVDGWLSEGLVRSDRLDAFVGPCRDGTLRVFRVTEEHLEPLTGWDRLQLGEDGDVFSPPTIVHFPDGRERLLVGGTEYGLLSLDLTDPESPTELSTTLYAASAPIVAAPLILPDQEVPDGRVIYGTLTGEVRAFPLEGGRTAWTAHTEGRIQYPPVYVPEQGLVIFIGGDARVYAFDASTGEPRWVHPTEDHMDGPPLLIGGRVLLLVLRSGKLIQVDPLTGERLPSFYIEPEGQRLLVRASDSGEQLFVATHDGVIRSLDGYSLRLRWDDEVHLPTHHAPMLEVMNDRLFVVTDLADPNPNDPQVFALDTEEGGLQWQSRFPEGRGRGNSLSAHEGLVLIATTKSRLHLLDRRTP